MSENDIGALCALVAICSVYPIMYLIGHLSHRRLTKQGEKSEQRKEKAKRPLCDVTCFRGPNGAFAVAQEDGDLWSVEQITDEVDGREGTFRSHPAAMKAARKWAGVVVPPTHPVPNRRGLVAHSRSKA